MLLNTYSAQLHHFHHPEISIQKEDFASITVLAEKIQVSRHPFILLSPSPLTRRETNPTFVLGRL